MQTRPSLLKKILQEAQSHSQNGKNLLAIFDLDSTLYDVSPRIAKILHAFSEIPEIQAHYPKEAELLSQVKPQPTDYGVKRTLARSGFTEPPHPDFAKKLVDYWRHHFFGNDYLQHDQPYPGAVDYVIELHKAGAEILYLTGRDVPRMLEGTKKSLKQWKFPFEETRVQLVLKPETAIDDEIFKRDFFKALPSAADRDIWFFENEPINIHMALEGCPHVKAVFVDTVHSERHPLPPSPIPRIKGFVEL